VNLTYDASSSSNCSYLQNLLRDEVMYLVRLHLFHGVKLRLIPWSATGAEKRLLNYDIEYLIEMEKALTIRAAVLAPQDTSLYIRCCLSSVPLIQRHPR